ncbi:MULTISPECIES: hypothetical protein [Helicobacter]|uniref:hypothetical protein n=1 Tax=Helicobacter TaxID=209 RepID=UPI0002EAA146|nr:MULTISPECIES: hypothetical protein [Helicobacter]
MKLEIIAITQCNKIKLIHIDKKRSCVFEHGLKFFALQQLGIMTANMLTES